MSFRKFKFTNNEIYHVIVRGVGDSEIFKEINDYYRAIFSLFEFNTITPVEIKEQREKRMETKKYNKPFIDQRDLLAEILAFCFMPNHIHLLIRQLKEDGVSLFMKKIGTGYASYFNKKYSRKGHLFQGKFMAVHIKDEEQLKTVFVYIHANPVSLMEPGWKEEGIKDISGVINFLENYKWSSYPDYLNKNNFSSLTERRFFLQVMGGERGCREFLEGWIKYKKEIGECPDLFLE